MRSGILIVIILSFELLLATTAMGRIGCLQGYFFDPTGAPVVDADLDFDRADTGERIYTPGDNTNTYGFYLVCVPSGIYHVSFAPPPGTHLLGRRFFDVDLSSNLWLDVTLDFGVVISGTVKDSFGNPIGNVDIDADNLLTGGRVYTPNDNSDTISGAFWVVVPPESYRLRFQPPETTRWIGLQLDSITVLSDYTINAILEEGMILSGFVTDNLGFGLEDVSIGLRTQATGEKIYVANNKSDTTGRYAVAVPTGLFELRFEPLADSRFVGVAVDSFAIEGDIVWNQVLQAGALVSAFVHDSTGMPIEGADLDFILESTGEKIFTPHDNTDSSGTATVAVLPDIYTIRVDPPLGSVYDQLSVTGVIIANDTTIDLLMPEVQRVNLSGKVVDSSGVGLQGIEIGLVGTISGTDVYILNNETDSAGIYNLAVPTGDFNALFSPPRGSHWVGKVLSDIVITQDTTWSDVALDAGYIISAQVLDPDGRPQKGVDFDFISEVTGSKIFTPHDNTDLSGTADITVPSSVYTIQITPPVGSQYGEQLINGFHIVADTAVTFFLSESSNPRPIEFVLQNNFPNPFNEATSISYVLFNESKVSIIIFNSLGQRVKTIDRGVQPRGYYVVEWNGIDSQGQSLASGPYFYRLKTSTGKQTRKMLLIR